MLQYRISWTKKLRLNRSRDPLGLRPLKKLEDYFLPGITTQTQRLRYYSFLAWAWKKIKDEDIRPEIARELLLSMEKVLALITQYNHQNDKSVPYGTRNTRSASDFLQHNRKRKFININEFTDFGYGGNNETGYGTYYYKNPLRILRIVWSEGRNKIRFSKVGESVADLFETMRGKEAFFLRKIPRRKLKSLHPFCLCNARLSKKERNIWRMIFFGFTKWEGENYLALDKQTQNRFRQGKLTFFRSPQEWYGFSDADLDIDNLQLETDSRAIGRRGTLMMIMKIVSATQPEFNEIDQIVRDTIYFRQFVSKSSRVKQISFGKLESLRVLWEVYVHNLYFISAFEEIFAILLKILESEPMGASLAYITSSLKLSSIEDEIKRFRFTLQDLENVGKQLKDSLGEKTNLKMTLNERKLFFNALSSETHEKKLANLIALLCLLRYRYSSFTRPQRNVLHDAEASLLSVTPSQFYKYVMKGAIESFVEKLFRLVSDRHRFVASIRYRSGTKCWLLTEEDGLLFHYGKPFKFRAYRESKWRNVAELLYDMGLLEKRNKAFKISRIGKIWLNRTK